MTRTKSLTRICLSFALVAYAKEQNQQTLVAQVRDLLKKVSGKK